MKKLISIFLILCMMATLLPTVAFATEGETATVDPIVVDFFQINFTDSDSDGKYFLSEANDTEDLIIDEDKSTEKRVYSNNMGAGLRVQMYVNQALQSAYAWPSKTGNETTDASRDKQNMFTISVNCESAGYYIPNINYGRSYTGGEFAVYINGQYAGTIDNRDDNNSGNSEETSATLNAVELESGENEISFRCTKHYKRAASGEYDATWLFLNTLTLTHCEEAFVPVTFTTSAFPERVVAGEAVNFEISADIDESQTKFTGTYNEDGSTMQTNLTVASENGTFEITEQSASVVKGTFTATNGGAATITATANVNGKAYTQTIETTAVAPIVATFPQNGSYGSNVAYPIANLLQDGTGYTVDTVNSIEGTPVKNYDGFVMIQFYVANNSTTGHPWPKRNENGFIFTINVEATTAGYYTSEFKHKASNLGAGFTMYVNGVAQGEIDGYIPGMNKYSDELTTNFNTVYLNEGQNEISFRLTKTYKRHTDAEGTIEASAYNGFWFYPRKLTFTPVDAAPTPVGFETTLTEAKVGEPVEFTVKPVMSDGSMYFGMYDNDGKDITDKPITLNSNSGTITNLKRTTEGVSGTFTATTAGTATITAYTNINGTPYENTFNVTVTADEDEVVTLPTTIKMSVSTTEEDKGYLVVNGTAQTASVYVYEDIAVGSDVTVVANPIDGKIFRGWLRGGSDGVVVSLAPEYKFKAATNVALFAKYTEAPAENAEAKEFYDWNGEFLAYDSYDSNLLSKYGFEFKEWLSDVIGKVTRYVADYEADNTYTITKPDGVTADIADLTSVPHETKITLTNETPVSWYVNGKLAAYGTSYTFYATEKADITIDETVQDGPIINLTNPDGNTYILEYNANGKTVIEKGIIFGEGTPSVTSCSYKVISQRNATFGKLMAENDEDCTVVRGYIIYKDGNTHRVVYADIAAQ
ncbi:MAG: hypothetical protein IJF32_04880 [Oscillospiraceae bacterium]|nr:hypothetical protein [Oscillospiraceae bacterium]